MRVYTLLNRLPWPRSYAGKFLAVAFVGVHVPLLTLLALAAARSDGASVPYLVAALVATLVGTAFVLWASYGLLAPVLRTAQALQDYGAHGRVPTLPTHFPDEAGTLMATTQQTLARLDRLLSFRRRLLGVLSHDLRTPLSSMMLAAGMLRESARDGTLDAPLADTLCGTVTTAVEQMDGVLTTILSASDLDAPELPYTPVATTTGAVVEAVAEPLRLIAARKGVALTTADAAGAALTTDAAQLEQVLANLVANAVKFTPPGRSVRLTTEAAPGGVVFVVADEGIGMDAEQVQAVFSAQGPAQRRGTEGEPGTGLGLWIVSTFARHLGGRVTLTSEPGAGTTFRVFVPATRPTSRA